MKTLLFTFPGNEKFRDALLKHIPIERAQVEINHFPDGESYVRMESDVRADAVLILCSLDHPDEKILPLIFLSRAARALDAKKVILITPYLAYMRQDKYFNPGEAVTSSSFAELLSHYFDEIITVDPHLHRIRHLKEVYSIPAINLHSAPLIAQWIRNHVKDPIIIGPDEESGQWVREIATGVNAPFMTLQKKHSGADGVVISLPDPERLKGKTAVFIDDIVASGKTMLKAVRSALSFHQVQPICIVIHGIFAGNSYQKLQEAGARVISCNTIPHESNEIDVSGLIAGYLQTRI